MDLTSWLNVSNDPMWEKKSSMIIASLVFSLAFTIAWYALFRIGIRIWGKDKATEFAKSKGYENYSEIMFDFTRNVFGGVMLFFMLAIFVYFISYQADVKSSINCAIYKSMADSCSNMSGHLVCQRIDNSQLFGNTSLGWESSTIKHSNQTS
jgi:hypothetical protein